MKRFLLTVLAMASAATWVIAQEGSVGASELTEMRKKAEAGDAASQFGLGRLYEEAQNHASAVRWYRKAAEQGHAGAQNNLGVMHRMGNGVERDKAEAVRWYRKAAEQGYGAAMFNMGAAYYNGDGVEEDSISAYAWFKLADLAGDESAKEAVARLESELDASRRLSRALMRLGQMFAAGEGVRQDPLAAAKWLEQAALRDEPEAMWMLAEMYTFGRGLTRDPDKASRWRNSAIALDISGAYAFAYGEMFRTGNGVPQNAAEALQWYTKAAERSYGPAMQNLGVMYGEGIGTGKDPIMAYVWFVGAWRKGVPGAERALDIIISQMSETELKKAQKASTKRWNFYPKRK